MSARVVLLGCGGVGPIHEPMGGIAARCPLHSRIAGRRASARLRIAGLLLGAARRLCRRARYAGRCADARRRPFRAGRLAGRAAARHQDARCAGPGGLLADVRGARERADVVVVSMHWGVRAAHHRRLPADHRAQAPTAGADLILGHHAHVPKAIEVFDGGKTCFFQPQQLHHVVLAQGDRGADEFQRNYGVPLDPEYPNMPYGVDGKRSLIAKAVMTPGEPIRSSFLPVLIDRARRPQILHAGAPSFDEMVRYMGVDVGRLPPPLCDRRRRGGDFGLAARPRP